MDDAHPRRGFGGRTQWEVSMSLSNSVVDDQDGVGSRHWRLDPGATLGAWLSTMAIENGWTDILVFGAVRAMEDAPAPSLPTTQYPSVVISENIIICLVK